MSDILFCSSVLAFSAVAVLGYWKLLCADAERPAPRFRDAAR